MHWAAMPPWLSLSGATTPWSQVEGVEGSLAQPPKLQTSPISKPRVAFGFAGIYNDHKRVAGMLELLRLALIAPGAFLDVRSQGDELAFLPETGHLRHHLSGLTFVCFSCRVSWTWKRAWR